MVKVQIATGRTHRIGVHLQHQRTPVYEDEVDWVKDWNGRLRKSRGIKRPLLHAARLEVEDMAEDMEGVVGGFGQSGGAAVVVSVCWRMVVWR